MNKKIILYVVIGILIGVSLFIAKQAVGALQYAEIFTKSGIIYTHYSVLDAQDITIFRYNDQNTTCFLSVMRTNNTQTPSFDQSISCVPVVSRDIYRDPVK